MTRYAVDETRDELLAMWETGYGAVAVRVAPLAESIEPRQRLALAAELSGLSEALWRCYTHPASAADSLEVNTEGWRREQTRDEFASVIWAYPPTEPAARQRHPRGVVRPGGGARA